MDNQKIHWYRYECKQARKGDEEDCDVKDLVNCSSCLRRLKNEKSKSPKPLIAKIWQPTRKVEAPYDLFHKFAEKNSCQSLNMFDHNKSKAEIVRYLNRVWVSSGSVSRGGIYSVVTLHECIPIEDWKGAFNDVDDEDADYYKGGRFRSRDGKWWVMTGYEIEVLPMKNERSLFIKEKLWQSKRLKRRRTN